MLINRLYLRNYRVFEDELTLELPPGLVGIYGPNGAGKSTLLEAVLFALWGKARTNKDEVRTAGVSRECVAEVEFEHEGHLYLVRRSLSGVNSTPRAQAACDGLAMSEGVRDTARYLHSVLGMDDTAFRASVFAEQKQLAAFSEQSPGDRRRLVLQLLGITPLDAARDAARKDARERAEQYRQLRAVLPDLPALEVAAADAEAAAAAAEADAAAERRAAEMADRRLGEAEQAFAALDQLRQEHETLVVLGRAARQELDSARERLEEARAELHGLDQAAEQLGALEPLAAGADAAEQRVRLLAAALDATQALQALEVPDEPPAPDPELLEQKRSEAAAARDAAVEAASLAKAAAAERDRVAEQAAQSASLSGEEACPLCGQALGEAFAEVQAHRQRELAAAEERLGLLSSTSTAAQAAARRAEEALARAEAQCREAEQARAAWIELSRRHTEAERALRSCLEELGELVRQELWAPGAGAPGLARPAAEEPDRQLLLEAFGAEAPTEGPSPDLLAAVLRAEREVLGRGREAAREAERLRGRLERRPALEAAVSRNSERLEDCQARVQALRDKLKALAYEPPALEQARAARDEAAANQRRATEAAHRAELLATEKRTTAAAAVRQLEEARAQHARLGELESESRHLGRVADLLSAFRNAVVASVGPRLATQAAELFGELTDHEYDKLMVDPETYELQVMDHGIAYGLERFSGSEIDLANLALRVAISEHVRFQSGGAVGLLVLDEVFGPLDEERKARMLLALERLRGRFRQVLVVTHDASIKEQLPHAIEVSKLAGRRASARLLQP